MVGNIFAPLRSPGDTEVVANWWPDEPAYAGQEHLDPDYVAGYERKAGFDPSADLDLLTTLGLGPDSTVVDLGAGRRHCIGWALEVGAAERVATG